jgi:hypothetical protein
MSCDSVTKSLSLFLYGIWKSAGTAGKHWHGRERCTTFSMKLLCIRPRTCWRSVAAICGGTWIENRCGGETGCCDFGIGLASPFRLVS